MDLAIQGVSTALGLLAFTYFAVKASRAKRSFWTEGVSKLVNGSDRVVGKFVGYVELLDAPIRAPVSGRECVYYESRATVQQLGIQSEQQTVVRDWCEFLLDDGSARVRVRLSPAATVALMYKFAKSGKKAKHIDAWGDTVAFIERNGGQAPARASIQNSALKEACLQEGERVAVCGRFTLEPDPDPPEVGSLYRSSGMRAVLEVPRGRECFVTDNPQLLEPLGVPLGPITERVL